MKGVGGLLHVSHPPGDLLQVVSEVLDLAALKRAAIGPLTVARVATPADVFAKALRWSNQ